MTPPRTQAPDCIAGSRWTHAGTALLLTLSALALSVHGEPPSLKHLYPAGAQAGTDCQVEVLGKADPWPPSIWTDEPGLTIEPAADKNRLQIQVNPNTPAGPCLIRLYNQDGGSDPVLFVVGHDPEVAEAEPNDRYDEPQRIAVLPAIVNGRLQKDGDVDAFAVWLEAGDSLLAELDAFSLGSPIDALMHLRDIYGGDLSFNHDHVHFDPLIAYQATHTGLHIIQVMGFDYPAKSDVRLGGGSECVYRLRLDTQTLYRNTIPMRLTGEPPQRESPPRLYGIQWNHPDRDLPIELRSQQNPGPTLPLPRISIAPEVSAYREIVEQEPNDSPQQAQALPVPVGVTGRLEARDDHDAYSFRPAPDTTYQLEVQSCRLGFQTDLWLRLNDANGKELTANDDANGRQDPMLTWTAKSAETTVVTIANRLDGGGWNQQYYLSIRPARPELDATVSGHTFTLQPGATNQIKVPIKRRFGFQEAVVLNAEGLPQSIAHGPVPVPDKDGEAVLTWVAATNAPPWTGPVRIVLSRSDGAPLRPIEAELVSSGINNGVPQGFPDLLQRTTHDLWLTVLPADEPTEEASNDNDKTSDR